MDRPHVIHIRTAPRDWASRPEYVNIGRPGPWGNPYRIGGDGTREEVIELYRADLLDILSDPNMEGYRQNLLGLAGKTLVCYCKPLACHGDAIVDAFVWLTDRRHAQALALHDIQSGLDRFLREKAERPVRIARREELVRSLAGEAEFYAGRINSFEDLKEWRERCWQPLMAVHTSLTGGDES